MSIQARLKNLLTTNDRRRCARDLKARRHVNIYALSIEFEAADKVQTALDFMRHFTPTGPNHTIAKKLWPGELDVDCGFWIKGTKGKTV